MGKEGGVGGCVTKKRPRFFKVFFPGLSSNQLEICPAFRKHMQCMRPSSTCLLTGPSRKVWRVDLINNENGLFFQKGWEDFVRDHSLEVGEFLVFEYEGGSRFSVLIFDATMCEKESVFGASSSPQGLAGSVEGNEPRDNGEKVKEEEPSSHAFAENKSTAASKRKGGDASPKAERKPQKKNYKGVWISQRRPVTKMEIDKAYKAACSFRSINPVLVQVMRRYDVYIGHTMRFPRPFSRQYLPRKQKMTLWDPTGKPWIVSYSGSHGQYFFCSGWRKFALANFLEQDDTCIFELIGANEIRVHIFRVVEEMKPLIRKLGF